jgi:RNA polymerase sigma-70 factor (ECF subfamily)
MTTNPGHRGPDHGRQRSEADPPRPRAEDRDTGRATTPDDEAAFVSALRTGDEAAFAELVSVHGPRMLSVARRILRDEDAARDALQDAFLSVHRSITTFEGRSSLGTWLHRIVANAALRQLRSRHRIRECALEDVTPEFDDLGYLVGPSTMTEDSVEELMHREEVSASVKRAIESLPETHRLILLLRDIEGYDTSEAAELLEISTSAAKVRLHRARLALKKAIQPFLRPREG